MSNAVKRLVAEGENLLARMIDEQTDIHIKWVVEFDMFEEALDDVRKEIEKGVL